MISHFQSLVRIPALVDVDVLVTVYFVALIRQVHPLAIQFVNMH